MSKLDLRVRFNNKLHSIILNDYRIGGCKWNDIKYGECIEYPVNKEDIVIALGIDKTIADLQSQLDQANERLKGAIVLPVKLGDTIYVVPSRTNYQINIINNKEEKNKVSEFVVDEIRYNKYGYSIVCYIDYIPFYFNYETAKGYCEHFNTEKFYGETWFTTREEAEKKLQELRGGE